MSAFVEWAKLVGVVGARQRMRHRHYRFRFRPAAGGALAVHVVPRTGGQPATLRLRPRTSDRRTFEQVFVEDGYWLAGLARWPELQARCAAAPAPLILDLGANIGLASLVLHWQLPRARVLAVEPQDGNFAQLVRHAQGIPAIEPMHAAVGAFEAWSRIANPDGPTAGFRTEPAEQGTAAAVRSHSMETLATAADGFLLVKMDIEGAEHGLMAADCSWLDRTDALIVEPHDWMLPHQSLSQPLLAALASRPGDLIVAGEHLLWLRAKNADC